MALTLPPEARRAFDRLAADLGRVFGGRLRALVAYTTRSSAAFVDAIGTNDLEALSPLVDAWHREGVATPLLISPDEFRRSLDTFPLEYQAMLDRHVLIAGADPFDDIVVPPADLRRATETQAKAHLIHLRQGWLESHGQPDHLAALAARSAEPFRALLTHVGRLAGAPADTDDALVAIGQRATGMAADLLRDLLALEPPAHGHHHGVPERARRVAARMTEYVQGADRLWRFIDGWPS